MFKSIPRMKRGLLGTVIADRPVAAVGDVGGLFVEAARQVRGVRRIAASRRGPVDFFIVALDEPWTENAVDFHQAVLDFEEPDVPIRVRTVPADRFLTSPAGFVDVFTA